MFDIGTKVRISIRDLSGWQNDVALALQDKTGVIAQVRMKTKEIDQFLYQVVLDEGSMKRMAANYAAYSKQWFEKGELTEQ